MSPETIASIPAAASAGKRFNELIAAFLFPSLPFTCCFAIH
jgi:hypothetical protein